MPAGSQSIIEGRNIDLTNLDKLLWPEDGYSKAELIHYYAEAAPFMLPHLYQRPLVFTRYPDGINEQFFYQKNAPAYLPGWIKTYPWESKERTINLLLAETTADLIWLANQACIEIHPWLSRQGTIDYPDFMIFDLDPSPGNTFQEVIEIALLVKKVLDELKIRAYIKTSGSEGLHIYVPVLPVYSYEEIRNMGMAIADLVSKARPDISTIERTVNKRGKRIYIDYMQNVIGKTICAPYSVRPRPGAPVSAPLEWDELQDITPDAFNIKNIFPRLARCGDLFSPTLNDKQNLSKVQTILGSKL